MTHETIIAHSPKTLIEIPAEVNNKPIEQKENNNPSKKQTVFDFCGVSHIIARQANGKQDVQVKQRLLDQL